MFGAFFNKKGLTFVIPICIFMFLTLSGVNALSAQPAPESLVNRFLEENQLMAISYLESNLENINQALFCLKDESVCEQNILYSRIFGEDVGLEFTQDELVSFIRKRHMEYRLLVGIHSFHAIRSGLSLGRGRMAIKPVHGVRSIIFDNRSEEGRREWETISSMAEHEFAAIEEHSLLLNEAGIMQGNMGLSSMRKMLESQIHSYTQKFPFLNSMNKVEAGIEDIIAAFEKLKSSYIDSLTHIARLQGEDLFELFGFVATIDETLQQFSQREQEIIEQHFVYLEENNTLFRRIISIVTSPKFLGLVACWTAAIFVPPVGVICGAIGLSISIPGVVNLAQQVNRMTDFLNTGVYDHDVYTKYMVGALVSAGLYMIVLKGSIPSFVSGVRSVRTSTREVVQRFRLEGRGALGNARSFLQQEVVILRDYFKYYLKDLSSNGVADLTLTNLGEAGLRSILPQTRNAFQMSLNRAAARNPEVILYSDLLRAVQSSL